MNQDRSRESSTEFHAAQETEISGDFIGSMRNMTGLQITILTDKGDMRSHWLSLPAVGKDRFRIASMPGDSGTILFEARHGEWYALSHEPARFQTDSAYSSAVKLTHGSSFSLENLSTRTMIYVEGVNRESAVFHNYFVEPEQDILIGRAQSNDIVYANRMVSRTHALLRCDSGRWTIRDKGSTNGIYVNGVKTEEAVLSTGDIVYIMGLRIAIGIGFLSMNDGNGRTKVTSSKVSRLTVARQAFLRQTIPAREREEDSFNRMPRQRQALPAEPIDIEMPPLSINGNQIPLLLRMGGSMVMGTSSLLAGNITMMLSAVLFPILTSKYTDRQKQEYEQKRYEKYSLYLRGKAEEILREKKAEEMILNANDPSIDHVIRYAYSKSKLWERRREDDDFLTLRIGTGRIRLLSEIQYARQRFSMDEDPLVQKMYELAEKKIYVNNVPIKLSLVQDRVCGVLGNSSAKKELICQLLAQLALLYSYDEVKIVVLGNREELEQIRFCRYLPHLWDDRRTFRFLASDEKEAYQISEYLKSELSGDLEDPGELSGILKKRPYYVVIALDRRIFDSMEVLKEVMQLDKNIGVSVLTSFEDLPKECTKIISLNKEREGTLSYISEIERENDVFAMDWMDGDAMRRSMHRISNISLKMVSMAYSLPKSLSFLEMYGVGRVEYLDPARRWRENNPVKSLAAPIGVGTDGTLFTLDLHEKYQGPHGLVAGMTGSGKSEWIITYLLSMALNYSPDEVAFILIDYKGGGLAGAFLDESRGIHLPHVVGTITNLDGAAINRSLMSIESELMRRQRIFNEAKSAANESTMDIYDYQRLYRNGEVKEPLPHLLIVADEFAELKKQEPEFMDKLISAARIGRSLGVHLILATQKPSGVVDDQIWSNTKFRVCLKVQSRGDSDDMLKRPEAAELRETGRFYLQVGYNEFFALGQSAWCGAPYRPADEVIVQRDDELQILDNVGQVTVRKNPPRETSGDDGKQIDAIVSLLSETAREEGYPLRSLWLEELPKRMSVDEIERKYSFVYPDKVGALIGEIDDPANQRQFPLYLDLEQGGNFMVVGNTGSGKSTMLQTILFDVAVHYPVQRVNFYILDMSSRNLRMFGKLPMCGAFLTDEEEEEIPRLFALIEEMISERRNRFSEAEVSSFEAYQEIEKIPLILLVVDNVTRFEEMKGRRELYDTLLRIAKSGVPYGIRLVCSVGQYNDCPTALKRECPGKLALHVKDRFAYSDILNMRCIYEPEDLPGRGECVWDGRCLEYQGALAVEEQNERRRSLAIHEALEAAASAEQMQQDGVVRRLRETDPHMEYSDFCSEFKIERIPLGIALATRQNVAVPLQQLDLASLYFGNARCAEKILRNLLYAMRRENARILIVRRSGKSVFDRLSEAERDGLALYPCSEEGVRSLLDRLTQTVLENKVHRNAYCEEHRIHDPGDAQALSAWRKYVRGKVPPTMVVFESVADVSLQIGMETMGKLAVFLKAAKGLQIYYWICRYWDDADRVSEVTMKKAEELTDEEQLRQRETIRVVGRMKEVLSGGNFAMLFGGNFNRQTVARIPSEYQRIDRPCSPENDGNCLLYYHQNCHLVCMPCGPAAPGHTDPDEMEII